MIAATLLLAGCGDDDEGDGPPGAGLTSGGSGEDSGAGELELETTGGFGSGGDSGGDSGADSGGGTEGADDWYAHWESDGVTLYTTPDGVLYGNSGTGEVCTQDVGVAGSLDWEPVLFSCQDAPFQNATLRLTGDTMAIEWDDRTEEVTKVESLAGQTVDLASLEATILN
ncbi:hypothetical protein [Streptomyces sp. 6N223]|uniref:hypothetical protein n=1 Tax=Streptomyces sp. 6N223 TaxID=3457412 RepID=UPI003FD57A0C